MNDSSRNEDRINLGSLGNVQITRLRVDENEIYAKFPSTTLNLCPDGITNKGTGGANFNDDSACPIMS